MAVYLHASFLRDREYLASKEFCAGLEPHSLDAVHELVPTEFENEYVYIGAPLPGLPSVVVFKGDGAPSPGAALLELEDHLWIRRGMEYLEFAIEQQLDELPASVAKKAHKALSRQLDRLVHTVSSRIKEAEVLLPHGSRVFVSMRS